MVTVRSYDNEEFEIEDYVAEQCTTLKNILEDDCASSVIPVQVESETLSKVITYLNVHGDSSFDEDDTKQFDDKFVDEDFPILIEYILAANFLDIKSLLDLCCTKFAKMIENKSVEFIRTLFGIENDFTQEEEQNYRQQYAWAFEGVEDD
ncbi:SKP1-like protein 11 [Forsythia ovata]|uniref:SKP1-like protein n=1 Tax=Forsythia ovata TaxID=205694 RepID=A0ABD1X4W2_9LAMI